MSDELMPFELPQERSSIIKVLGVGGGGSNAVNHMYKQGIKDVNFVITNTDAQALENSPVPIKVQLGESLTEGRGAGNKPDRGRQAAIENIENVLTALSDTTKMVFITAGMGGGTGTGAAPIIAKATKELGILTVAIVTLPFRFEGKRRLSQAREGIAELSQNVDSLLVIENEKLREIFGDLKYSEAFSHADDVLTVAAKGIAEIITVHGHLNVDFADVQTVMNDSGVALMGSGRASGENRAIKAVQQALSSPLLNNNDIEGAQDILLNIISGNEEATMDEISEINEYVQEAAGYTADLIWGNTTDPNLGNEIAVTVIATGFKTDILPEVFVTKAPKERKQVHKLFDNTEQEEPKQEKEVFKFELNDKEENNNSTFQDDPFQLEDDNSEDIDDTNFKVNDKRAIFDLPIGDDEQEPEQDEEELDFNNESIDNDSAQNLKKAEDRINIFNSREHNKGFKYSEYRENIDELETTPAYIRKKKDVENNKRHSSESNVSRYTLKDTGENGLTLKDNNSFLHDRVD